jgi:hypothetical protein
MIDFYFLEISRSTGDSEIDLERLGSAIQVYWDIIPRGFFDKLYVGKM